MPIYTDFMRYSRIVNYISDNDNVWNMKRLTYRQRNITNTHYVLLLIKELDTSDIVISFLAPLLICINVSINQQMATYNSYS